MGHLDERHWVLVLALVALSILTTAASHGQVRSTANQTHQKLWAREDIVLRKPIALHLCTIGELDAGYDYLNCPDISSGLRVRVVGEHNTDIGLHTEGAFRAKVFLLKASGQRIFLGALRSTRRVSSGFSYLEAVGIVFAPDAEPGDRIGVKVFPKRKFKRLSAGQNLYVSLGAS